MRVVIGLLPELAFTCLTCGTTHRAATLEYPRATPEPKGSGATPKPTPPVSKTPGHSREIREAKRGEECPVPSVHPGLVEPLRMFDGYAAMYRALAADFSAKRGRGARIQIGEAEARKRFCSAVASHPQDAQEVLQGGTAPRLPGKPECEAPGPHWIELFPYEDARYRRWQITPVPGGRFVAVAETRWGWTSAGPLQDDLDLTREGRLVIAQSGRRSWHCAKNPAKACLAEKERRVCPDNPNDECVYSGYAGRVIAYDPLADISVVFGTYTSAMPPEVTTVDASIEVKAGSCVAEYSFPSPPGTPRGRLPSTHKAGPASPGTKCPW
jgi:hypothetical protein